MAISCKYSRPSVQPKTSAFEQQEGKQTAKFDNKGPSTCPWEEVQGILQSKSTVKLQPALSTSGFYKPAFFPWQFFARIYLTRPVHSSNNLNFQKYLAPSPSPTSATSNHRKCDITLCNGHYNVTNRVPINSIVLYFFYHVMTSATCSFPLQLNIQFVI